MTVDSAYVRWPRQPHVGFRCSLSAASASCASLVKRGQKYTAQAIDRPRRGPVKQCFANAARLTWKRKDVQYVEGFAQSPFHWMHHAWCVDGRGSVIEPTWEPSAFQYFGVVIDAVTIARLVTEGAQFGQFLDHLAAKAFLDGMPSAVELMPAIKLRELDPGT